MRHPKRMLETVLGMIELCGRTSNENAGEEHAWQLVGEYSRDIPLVRQSLGRGLVSETSLALKHEYRGESYLLYLGRPELARADLAAAISTFERVIADAECDAADLSLAISHFPRSLLFRGHAQRELGRLDAALADVTRAVERFEEAIAAGRESLEPLFAWALQSRAEILLEAYGDGAGARRDLDLAIAILGKWSRRQEGLVEKLSYLRQLRAQLAPHNEPNRQLAHGPSYRAARFASRSV